MTIRNRNEYRPERRYATLTPGEMLKELRQLQGFSQTALAKLSGIPQTTISAFETGAEEMGLRRIRALAEALDVHPAVLAFPDWKPARKATLRRKLARSA